jgi:PrtD family type I secretion system ABC transporter
MSNSPSGRPSLLSIGGGTLVAVALVSGVVNILTLSGSLFMMEVYDRVLPSRSLPTLAGLALIVAVMYAFQGFFDVVRGRILVRLASTLDETVGHRVFKAMLKAPLQGKSEGDGGQPQRDLDQVRSFLSGGGPSAMFDLPWMPIYLAICFMFHPWIGLTALGGMVLIVFLTGLTEFLSREAAKGAAVAGSARNGIADAGRRNAEVVQAMGMGPRLGALWGDANARFVANQGRSSDVSGGFGSVSKVLRMMVQSAVLAVGAVLVIDGQATGGIMIASSILVSRAMAPVELAIGNWKSFVPARQGWRRLQELLAKPDESNAMPLPPPRHHLAVEAATAGHPGAKKPIVQDIAFRLGAGSALGVIGQSGSGKSTLARLLVGVWPTWNGKIRLDGAALEQWRPEQLGAHVGYLPQDVELFAGTIAQNISRFEAEPDPEAVIAAATAADVHDLVLRLPEGYKTQIGAGGANLSGGQRQRIALARALYRDPFLVVLDEPNSNLDAEGEQALTQAIKGVRQRGGIVVVVAHRPSALAAVDQVLLMADGRVQAMGPKDEILAKLMRAATPPLADPKAAAAPVSLKVA